jgi:signal transduction histidine kinase
MLALLDELRQAEMRATSSQVASIIGHMIGTPLNVIVGRAALLRASPTAESMVDNARRIEEQAQRLTERVQRLIHYLTPREPEYAVRTTSAVVEDAVELYRPIAEVSQVVLNAPLADAPEILVDGTPTLMVLSSLLSLAIRTAGPGQVVELGVEVAEGDRGVLFSVWVPGMPALQGRLDRLDPPERYDPTSAERDQLLSMCAAIAKRHGGSLTFEHDSERVGASIRYHCAGAEPAR